jgi:YVTN family beta-propeller protein
MPILPGRGAWRVALALGLVAIFVLESASGGGAHVGAALPGSRNPPVLSSVSATSRPTFPGFSEKTLELLNGTVVPGNRDPPTGLDPILAVPDSTAGKIFTVSGTGDGSASLDIVNATSDGVLVELPLPGYPGGAALDANGSILVLGEWYPNVLLVLNTTTDSFVSKIPLASGPQALAFDPLNGFVYVSTAAGPTGGEVLAVNLTSSAVVTSIPVGPGPGNLVVDPANGDVYVPDSGGRNVTVLNGSNNSVAATIPTGNVPWTIAIDPANDTVYILDVDAPINLTVVDGATNTVRASIPLPGPYNSTGILTYDPATSLLYVGLSEQNFVWLLSASNDSLVRNVTVGDDPYAMALDPAAATVAIAVGSTNNLTFLGESNSTVLGSVPLANGNPGFGVDPATGALYLPIPGGGQLEVVNGSSRSIVTNVTLGFAPDGIQYDPSSGEIYVTEPDTAQVSLVNGTTQALDGTVETGGGASEVTLCPAVDRIFVTNSGAGTVSVFNATTNALLATRAVGSQPHGTVWDPLDGNVFVADTGDGHVTVLNGTTGAVVTTLSGLFYPVQVTVDPSDLDVYVMGLDGGPISVINTTSFRVVANVSLGGGTAVGMAYDPATSQVWVATNSPNEALAISASTHAIVTAVNLSTGGVPNGMAIDPANGTIAVTAFGWGWDGVVIFVDPTSATVLGRVDVGDSPGSILFDPAQDLALVVDVGNNSVTVVNLTTDTREATYPTGPGVTNLAFDPTTSTYYATNNGGGTLTLFGPAFPYPVRFQETGLPVRTNWSVSWAGTNASSTNATVEIEANNGTDGYAIPPVPGFAPAPSTGSVTIGGSGLNVSVTFRPTYPVRFREFGLPNGTAWSVQFNGSTANALGSAITLPEPNGSYPFTVAGVPGSRTAVYSGILVIDGHAATEFVNWTRVVYAVNFTAVGLPAGKSWAVLVDNTTHRSATGAIGLSLPNGSYAYSIAGAPNYAPVTASGTFGLDGGPVARAVTFTAGYLVDFWESGLPNGTAWSVTLNGSLNLSSGSTVGFEVPNGTLSFDVGNVPGWRPFDYAGSVSVSGGARYIGVTWNRTLYSVEFVASGLPSDTLWEVTVGATVLRTIGYANALSEPNGSFPYSVANVPGWRTAAYTGVVNVSGGPREIGVPWNQTTFPITFEEVGLSPPVSWEVTLRVSPQGTSIANASSGGSLGFVAGNGSYEYRVTGITGWEAFPSAGILTVDGGAAFQRIVWTNVLFGIQLDERGLPTGTSWAATVGGTTDRANGTSLDFSVQNGTYWFNVSNVPGWRANTYGAFVTVFGAVATVLVNWTPTTYTATVLESDVAPPIPTWTVVLNGTTESGVASSYRFDGLVNGTYSLVVRAPVGYAATSATPTAVTIAGASTQLVIEFLRTPVSTGPVPTFGATWVILLGGGAVAVGVVVLAYRFRRPPHPPGLRTGPPPPSG